MIIPQRLHIVDCGVLVEGLETNNVLLFITVVLLFGILIDFNPKRQKTIRFLHFNAENRNFQFPQQASETETYKDK